MRQILFFIIVVCTYSLLGAQVYEASEKVLVVAKFVNNAPIVKEFSPNDLNISSKINRALKMEIDNAKLKNERIFKVEGRGWFLEYTFRNDRSAGIYQEQLKLLNDQLVISENRNAVMAKATNCKKVVFTTDDDKCSCAVKLDYSKDSKLSYRVMTIVNN